MSIKIEEKNEIASHLLRLLKDLGKDRVRSENGAEFLMLTEEWRGLSEDSCLELLRFKFKAKLLDVSFII